MRVVDLIKKKRDGQALTPHEIGFLVRGYTSGEIPDYQMSAFLMAVVWRGMSDEETFALTVEMLQSGCVLDLSDIPGIKVDKHSTGGVGDKTSLILAPLAAAAGVPVPMISGRGLAHSGGTLDKLESIPGFRVNLSVDEYRRTLKQIGLVLIGQTSEIAPADRKLYALRDVTATVECIPLIAGSIMSKKIAEGIDALVLDVKVGKGAFMKTEDGARRLAETLVGIGRSMGKQVRALITDMNQPLGQAVGNALEVRESLETLKGRGPEDLTTLSVELAAHMVVLGERAASLDKARELVKNLIASGAGLEKFRQLIEAQGGDPLVVDDDDRLPKAALKQEYKAETDGFLLEMDAERIGIASMVLGAGRERVDSPIDHAVGIWLSRKVGDHVARGDVLCTVYYNDEARLKAAAEELRGAFVIGEQDPPKENLIKMVL
jgi:pyrimidine-nucleoside phosphorylase